MIISANTMVNDMNLRFDISNEFLNLYKFQIAKTTIIKIQDKYYIENNAESSPPEVFFKSVLKQQGHFYLASFININSTLDFHQLLTISLN